MKYKQLGRTGLYVSQLCPGTMTDGGSDERWGRYGRLKQAAVDAELRAAVDAEVNFIDTVSKLDPEFPGWMVDRQAGPRRASAGQ